MGVYRFEMASTGRAGCKATDCAKEAVKIQKGELRYGSQVDYQGNLSWSWRHWGCVTPAQIENLRESTNGDLDYVDGYDEVPPEMQDKIKRALDQGHIDDEDWKGDIELNRPGQKGKRKPAPKNKKEADEDGTGDQNDKSPSKAPKKRGRPKKEEGEGDEEPKTKKAKPAKKKSTKDGDDDGEELAPKKTKAAAKKGKKDEEGEDADELVQKNTKAATKKGKKSEEEGQGREGPIPKKSKAVGNKATKDSQPTKEKDMPKKTKNSTTKGRKAEAINEEDSAAVTTGEEEPPHKSKPTSKKMKTKADSNDTKTGEEAIPSGALAEPKSKAVKDKSKAAKGGSAALRGEKPIEENASGETEDEPIKSKRGRKRAVNKDTGDASKSTSKQGNKDEASAEVTELPKTSGRGTRSKV